MHCEGNDFFFRVSYIIPEDSANSLVQEKHIHMKIWGDADVKISLKL